MITCEQIYWEICFVTPASDLNSSIFGFAEFISALALLVIVYTVTDIRYRFRVAVAPIPLFRMTYFFIGFIGLGTLLTDIWLREKFLVPSSYISQSIWQGMFGALFLLLALTWIYYAFINPPIFSEKNFQWFAHQLYQVILKGSNVELPVIADELARSADSLVKLSKQNSPKRGNNINEKENKENKPNVGGYAHDVFLLVGNRKLCRYIIASSPITAISFFKAMADNQKYNLPFGQFAKNISSEAIINKDSILYHEDEGYNSGLIGYLKPFSQTLYGNYQLVETLRSNNGSPLDLHYEVVWSWDATQFEAYCRIVMITLENYLKNENWYEKSLVLQDAFENIGHSCRDIYKLNDISSDYYSTDIFKRLDVAVNFVKEAIVLINKQENLPTTRLRVRDKFRYLDFYDQIANLMFEIIFSVTSVTKPSDKCWAIQHNAVWSEFFGIFSEGKAWKIIHFKLRRLLYNEILRLGKFPNYKSSRILGFCLNVMGLKIRKKETYDRDSYPLHKTILAWTKKNYLGLKHIQPEVAESCILGSLSFDESGTRLIKTFAKGLSLEAPKEYLELNQERKE